MLKITKQSLFHNSLLSIPYYFLSYVPHPTPIHSTAFVINPRVNIAPIYTNRNRRIKKAETDKFQPCYHLFAVLLILRRGEQSCREAYGTRMIVIERAAWAPFTSTCAMSAVFDGPAMNTP